LANTNVLHNVENTVYISRVWFCDRRNFSSIFWESSVIFWL